ncbi:hypothetical protein V498_05792 [Pseudogymnoascus sp. VKM F-4517 (FW-2822)]|nr:hypothetical protein V498_05792 [Pseudogymnoascus sp. VKM F-4517 (FW-2822)]
MSELTVPETLVNWQKVSEHDGVLTEESITTASFLTGESFLSSCWLPDVKPNTKIVGICGISDWNKENDPKLPGNAAPNREGWHFADFYLFHHMLKEVASDQVWLTCVSPESAVEKYGRYVYGDYTPKKIEDRRVVLDKTMLVELNNVQTVSPEDLLDSVIETINKTCIEAAAEGRPVLILIFSRGPAPAYSIVMGGDGEEDSKFLTKESFQQAIGSQAPEAGLCLLATEYYTGAWAINPDVKVAPFASQGKYFESLAWPISGTIHKRPCGQHYSHRIADTILRLNLEGFVAKITDGNRGADYEEYDRKLYDVVENILEKEESKDKSLFSGDDEWETEYSERIGIHISEFYRRWCLLKDATPGYDELLAAVKSEGNVYLDSYPGSYSMAMHEQLHSKLRGIIKGTAAPRSFIELEILRRQIDYRLNVMKTATKYKDLWRLTFKNCEDYEVDIGAARDGMMLNYAHDQDIEYDKGEWYIASCIYSQGWDDVEAAKKIEILIHYRVTEAPARNTTDSVEPVVCSWPQQVRGFSKDQDLSALQKEAKQYFNSKLRVHDRATDTNLHGPLHHVLRGNKDRSGLGYLRSRVNYRVNQIMGTATLYKDFLDIDYPGCHEVDVEKFRPKLQGPGILRVPDSGVPNLKGASQIIETIDQFRLSTDERIRPIIWKFAEITNCRVRSLPLNTCRQKDLPHIWLEKTSRLGLGS